jgi:hypothetical protein
MLYVIVTDDAGAVQAMHACDDGIDEAIRFIAGAITHAEEDSAVAEEIVADTWRDAVHYGEPSGAHQRFAMRRRGHPYAYGLAVAPLTPAEAALAIPDDPFGDLPGALA